jgi:hypothetical protein
LTLPEKQLIAIIQQRELFHRLSPNRQPIQVQPATD